MHAPVLSSGGLSGPEAHKLLDATLKKCAPDAELDRDLFEAVYRFGYKQPYEEFDKTGNLPPAVVEYCRKQLRTKKS